MDKSSSYLTLSTTSHLAFTERKWDQKLEEKPNVSKISSSQSNTSFFLKKVMTYNHDN